MNYADAESRFLAQRGEVVARVARLETDLARLERIRAGLDTPRGRRFAAANAEATVAMVEGYQRYVNELEGARQTLSDCWDRISEYQGPGEAGTDGYGFIGVAIVGMIALLGIAAASIYNSMARVKEAEVERDRLELIEAGVIETIPYRTLIISGGALLLLTGGGAILKKRRRRRKKAG